jgi:hypothetical protein
MGRPRKNGSVMKVFGKCHLTISINENLRDRALTYAYQHGKTLSQLISELLKQEMDSNSNKSVVINNESINDELTNESNLIETDNTIEHKCWQCNCDKLNMSLECECDCHDSL